MVLKQIWDVARYISFVFHHKSAQVEAKKASQEETEEKAKSDEEDVESSSENESDSD